MSLIKYKKAVFRNLALISQIGISVISPILLCLFLGYYTDKYLKTSYWILIFLILGVVSGANLAYKLVMSSLKQELKEDKEYKHKNIIKMNKKKVHSPKIQSRIFKE